MTDQGTVLPDLPDEVVQALSERYRFEREVSRGLLARVFRVYDLKLERHVALKLLRADVGLSIGRERFLDEIRIAASLVHPNIVPVHDAGSAGEHLYFTMPFIEGESLRARLEREGQLSREETVRLSRGVAEALLFAQARGIVHRDVKPENVMLDGNAVLLTDFGIARLTGTGSRQRRTSIGLAVGTPGYMSPEQAAGGQVDSRSDVYSLGCVVYEMLAGEPPFTGPSPQAVIARHLSEAPRPLRTVRASLPGAVDVILARALAKNPADRYPTALEFVGDLERAVLTPVGQEATVVTPAAVPVRRRPLLLVTLVAVGLVAALASVLWSRRTGLDDHRVAIFPLSGVDSAGGAGSVTYLGYVLEGTEPLRWENGAEWLRGSPDEPGGPGARSRAQLARRHGAGRFLDGEVVDGPDSTTVVMRLYDVRGDSVIARRGRSGARGASVAQLAAAATVELLPYVVPGGRAFDVAGLGSRSPAAIANLLQGDVAYHSAQYEAASRFYLRAAADPEFALPLVRAAQAMSWLDRQEAAESLTVAAISSEARLPPRYRAFARAALYRAQGRADSALAALDLAIRIDSSWAEAWMMRGEVYYHLMPDVPGLDSLAADAFRTARRRDPAFVPPLYHLAEVALRAGDLGNAAALLDTLRRSGADTALLRPLALVVRCATVGMAAADWTRELSGGSVDVLEAAKTLSGSPRHLRCAEDAFRAVAEWDSVSPAQRFGAYQGWQGVLVARGASGTLREVLDSERARAASAHYFYVFNAAAGLGFDDEAAAVVREIEARPAPLSASALWLLGVWHASRGDAPATRLLADSLRARAAAGGGTAALLADIISAHALLATGDTAGAIAALAALRPVARQRELTWTPWDALALERLTLARLLLARGDLAGVLRAGSAFDASQPIMFIGLRPAALALRATAAEGLARRRLAERYRQRLAAFTADANAPASDAGQT